MKKGFTFIIISILILYGCKEPNKAPAHNGAGNADTTSSLVSSRTDSVDILFFIKPFTDSSRYTRFYRAAKISDSSFQSALTIAMENRSTVLEKPRPCLSEGKIILPKGGDAFKVIYFSRDKGNSCSYIYEIRNGLFYYYELPGDLKLQLDNAEKKARRVT